MGSRAGNRPRLWQWPSLRMMELGNGVRLGLLHAHRGKTMEYYAGIDVSLESASLCVVDATGRIVREAKVASEPEILIGWFRGLELEMTRIGLEAGPLSQWLYAGMREAGLAVELLETRHVPDAFKAMPVKTDRNDARGIAQLMRLGWFRPVHCKSLPAQETRALLTARKLLQTKNHDVEMNLRGVLRGFGLKVGRTTPRTFLGRIRELVADHPTLSVVAEALLAARSTLFEQWHKLEKRLRSLAREDGRVRAADDPLSSRYASAEFTNRWPRTEAACTAALSAESSRSMRSWTRL